MTSEKRFGKENWERELGKGSGKGIWERDLFTITIFRYSFPISFIKFLPQISFPDPFPRSLSPIPFPILFPIMLILFSSTAFSDVFDPLGNRIFVGKGTSLYSIDATYGLLQGGSAIRKDAEFKKRLRERPFVTFDIGEPDDVNHQISVGDFRTQFSDFTLNKELVDGIRWNITVPKSRGRISTFVAKLTNTTFGQENKTIISDVDWFMVGARAEANLGSWYLKFANFPEFELPLPRLGISYANRFFTNFNLSQTTNPFQGVALNDPPSELFLRFKDASPENPNGSKLFRLKLFINGQLEQDLIGGQEPPGLLLLPHKSLRDNESRWVEADGFFIYKFVLFEPQQIKDIRFELDLANDYLVELSTDGTNYQLELSAKGNVANESNRGWRKFHYGVLTGETTVGLDLQTVLWGIAIEAERGWFWKNIQYPNFKGNRAKRGASAWFVDANRRLGPLFLAAETTFIDPFYNASEFVDDNDDQDPYLDEREPFAPRTADREDLDGDGIQDFEDDFLMFFADPPKFSLGLSREFMDFNNNGVPDNIEDDHKPDYRLDYEEGSYGYHIYVMFDVPFIKGFSVIPGYYTKKLLLDKKSSKAWYNLFFFTPERIPNFGTVQIRYMTRRAHDIIPDDHIERGVLIKDNLALQNYLNNIVTLIADYDNIKNLTFRSKFKYEYDALFNTRSRVVDAILINQVKYDYRLRPDLTISPTFRSDRSIGYTVPFSKVSSTDVIRNAFILTLTHRIAEQLQFSAGAQYLTWRDHNDPAKNFNRKVGFLELALEGDVFGQKVGLINTVDFSSQNFLEDVGGSEKSTNISVTLFLL